MNYLQLVQRLRQESGLAGNGPLSVSEQTGEFRRLVDMVNSAWLEIQGKHINWDFMRREFSVNVGLGATSFTPADAGAQNLREWDLETFRCYQTAIGIDDEQFMVNWDYYVFRDTYLYASRQPGGRPLVFTQKPRTSDILLGPQTDAPYTIVGEYTARPSMLVGDADTPAIPEEYHMVIVFKALEYYALKESAGELLALARTGMTPLMAQLERDQLPSIQQAEPLA